MKHMILVNVDYVNISLIFINAYKCWHVNKKAFKDVFDFNHYQVIYDDIL